MWDIKVILDAGDNNVGTISATWTEGTDTFTQSERITLDDSSKAAFIQNAITQRDAWKQKLADAKVAADLETTIAATILSSINTADVGGK
jgi:hypothetical protein